jgi:hypothetical protein
MNMMWRRWGAVVVSTVGCAAGAGALGIACGGGDDNSTNAPDAATADGTVVTTDAGRRDGEAPDATTDGAADAKATDATTDGSTIDGSTDAGDGSVTDAEAGIDPALLAFPTQLATAFCAKLAACCAGLDAGVFDPAGCVATETPQGYSASLAGSAGFLDSGLLTLNATKAQACLADIAAVDCSANILTTQGQISILNDCTEAIVGVLGVGSPCITSIECATNEYCETDGGPQGQCMPLSGDGGSCAFTNGNFGVSEEACSFRRSGNTDLRCANADLNTGTAFDASTWVCGPVDSLGGGCNFNQDCVTQICDRTSFTCANSVPFVTRTACVSFDVKDAGGD